MEAFQLKGSTQPARDANARLDGRGDDCLWGRSRYRESQGYHVWGLVLAVAIASRLPGSRTCPPRDRRKRGSFDRFKAHRCAASLLLRDGLGVLEQNRV